MKSNKEVREKDFVIIQEIDLSSRGACFHRDKEITIREARRLFSEQTKYVRDLEERIKTPDGKLLYESQLAWATKKLRHYQDAIIRYEYRQYRKKRRNPKPEKEWAKYRAKKMSMECVL